MGDLPGRVGSGNDSTWRHDARGVLLCCTCPACHARENGGLPPGRVHEPNHWADEPIEDD